MRNASATGSDNLSVLTLKHVKNFIAVPLTHIFNRCLLSGIFPEALKTAIITPIHKANDRKCVGNYRPISILSHISKLLEKCIKSRLMKYLQNNNLISKNQFGFQPRLSTQDAILDVTSKIYESLGTSKKSLVIFLDLAKAFDTVDHNILL